MLRLSRGNRPEKLAYGRAQWDGYPRDTPQLRGNCHGVRPLSPNFNRSPAQPASATECLRDRRARSEMTR